MVSLIFGLLSQDAPAEEEESPSVTGDRVLEQEMNINFILVFSDLREFLE